MQSENGPCALLAIGNYLILTGSLVLSERNHSISSHELIQKIANIILDIPRNVQQGSPAVEGTPESLIESAVNLLPSLNTGLHVDVKFGSALDFKPIQIEGARNITGEAIFQLLRIPLFHAWVVSQDDTEMFSVLYDLSYEEAVMKIAQMESISRTNTSGQGTSSTGSGLTAYLIRSWLEDNSAQITIDGLIQILSFLEDRKFGVLFRNNHFSTIVKINQELYALVTDIGFLNTQIVWESIDQLDGDTRFLQAFTDPAVIPVIPRPLSRGVVDEVDGGCCGGKCSIS
jgi:ubiquitin carboxyl-terminal hydrolase MINDY-1/2